MKYYPFLKGLTTGFYMEFVKRPGVRNWKPHWEVIDYNGHCLTTAKDEDEALDKAYRKWQGDNGQAVFGPGGAGLKLRML